MRSDNLPLIQSNTSLKEAIIVMSEGKLGNVFILDESQKFIALLSDGDLRRELLASDALAMIENERIQVLPITNEEGNILGVLHIHDLINAGIKSK